METNYVLTVEVSAYVSIKMDIILNKRIIHCIIWEESK